MIVAGSVMAAGWAKPFFATFEKVIAIHIDNAAIVDVTHLSFCSSSIEINVRVYYDFFEFKVRLLYDKFKLPQFTDSA